MVFIVKNKIVNDLIRMIWFLIEVSNFSVMVGCIEVNGTIHCRVAPLVILATDIVISGVLLLLLDRCRCVGMWVEGKVVISVTRRRV